MKGRASGRAAVVFVTCPTRLVGRRIAGELIREHLAACVNLIPGVESLFTWQGKTERCHEVLLVIKTTARCFEDLRKTVLRLHPYKVPEIISLPLTAGHPPYLAWVQRSTKLPS